MFALLTSWVTTVVTSPFAYIGLPVAVVACTVLEATDIRSCRR
jgi:hypothetical protein